MGQYREPFPVQGRDDVDDLPPDLPPETKVNKEGELQP